MKKIFNLLFIAAATFGLAACDTDVEHNVPEVEAPVCVATTPTAGANKVKKGDITIEVQYDKNVNFATKNLNQIQFTGGTLVSADVYGASNILTVKVNVPTRGTQCTLTIPAGVVTGPNQMPAPEVTTTFSTTALDNTLVAATSAKAVKLYSYLLQNFESKTLSGMMANVSWNTEMSERVYQWTGKYPAINTFDYGHLPSSVAGANWINYGDITPVKEWSDNGGIVSCMWHWNVPKEAPVSESLAITLWEGEQSVGNWDYISDFDMRADNGFDTSKLAEAQVGQSIIVHVTGQTTDPNWWQGSVKNSGWSDLTSGSGVIDLTATQTSYSVLLTEEVLAEIQANGFVISGCNHTVTGIYIGTAAQTPDVNNGYAFYMSDTSFDAANATVEGTWEYEFFQQDLANITAYLKLLKEADIPVLWRPFHEAAGGWFWWGKDAASFKALWIAMFNYFKAEGLDNLIWVYTAEPNDEEWYPGDAYVDIIGRDLYSKGTADCASEFSTIAATYGNKMVALSECGSVGTISEQWAEGARWSWFMPWYDGENEDGSPIVHADEAWWQDAMNQSYVLDREAVKAALQ